MESSIFGRAVGAWRASVIGRFKKFYEYDILPNYFTPSPFVHLCSLAAFDWALSLSRSIFFSGTLFLSSTAHRYQSCARRTLPVKRTQDNANDEARQTPRGAALLLHPPPSPIGLFISRRGRAASSSTHQNSARETVVRGASAKNIYTPKKCLFEARLSSKRCPPPSG